MRAFITFLLCFASQMLVYNYIPSLKVALALSSETDKLALLALKVKLTNGVPDSLPSWNESLHFCEWQGVICSKRHMRVSVLNLENQYWGGILGPSLSNLTFLRILKLSNINLQGDIPKQVGHLKRLRVLDLSKNNLQGEVPIELKNCTNLQVINLLYNKLNGKVPSWFESMMHLTKLLLGANNLVGTIPPSLGNISTLQNITLAGNHLEGRIPRALGMLSNLRELNLGLNNLSNEVPHSLYNLSNIQVFVLGENQLFGTLPPNMHLAFPDLRAFLMGGNHLTGTFPSSISNLTKLRWFDISDNGFSGPIPPTLGSLNKLQRFNINKNNFGSGSAQDLGFLSSLTNCTQLQVLILDYNRFGGALPDLVGNLSSSLNWLSMAGNEISGMIPKRIGHLIGLTDLNMMENFLEGTIPDSIAKLKNLGRLVLQENNLYGNIPIGIGNLTRLSELYLHTNQLEGSIPSSLRHCTQLQSFGVSDNNLSGEIPNQTFGYLEGLINFDLSNNSLTGPLPSEFGNLKHLSILNLYENKLVGEIPNELGACVDLTELMLERNFFYGGIPSSFGSLKSLQFLNLSSNNLSSKIPPELANLTLLDFLDLSFNYLYGEVPIGGIFDDVAKISIIGNNGLCGGIPQFHLSACPSFPSNKEKRSLTLKKKHVLIIVIGGVLIIFIAIISVCFLRRKPKKLVCLPSLKNRHLRITYGELHEATNGFSSSNLVGKGNYGSVYKGTLLHFERPIAVKVLNLETRGAAKSFMAECKALGRMKHRNLLRILTCCSSVDYKGEDFKAIVYELMHNGSLENLLHHSEQYESANQNMSLAQSVDIALDVAHALDYLHHDSNQVVVHCDVKPSNVLVDEDFVGHLGDFGLAKLIYGNSNSQDQVSSSAIKGTIGYVPPEYGAGGPVSIQGDIYSYGILLLEMFTGKRPTDNMFGEILSLHKFCKMGIQEGRISEIVDSRLVITFAEHQSRVVKNNFKECLVSFARIGVACSEEFSAHRMCMKDVIVKLNEIKKKCPST